jgi:peptidylprolyl isomerase
MAGERELEISVAEVVDLLRVTGRFQPVVREVVERKLTVEEAKKKGLKVTVEELQKAADGFRLAHGLNKASTTEAWLKSVGVSVEALEDYLETNLLIDKLMDALEGKEVPQKYLASPAVKGVIRGTIYQEWLSKKMK